VTVSGLCFRCGNPAEWLVGEDYMPPHCYGEGDERGTPGLIGSGFHCSCECRRWPHRPNELYNLAASEHPNDLPAIRDRYRALMVEHGHIVSGTPRPLPCGYEPFGSGAQEATDGR
jgi:hypothetical protein